MELNCNCILCLPEQNPDQAPPPNVYCKNRRYWHSALEKCCCTKHDNCIKSRDNQCLCPKCCRCKDQEKCITCCKMGNTYYVCNHQLNGIDDVDGDCELYKEMI